MAVKGQALADHLPENIIDGEYEPLKTSFPNEEVSFVGEDIAEAYDGWRIFFDVVVNFKGVGIRIVFISKLAITIRFPQNSGFHAPTIWKNMRLTSWDSGIHKQPAYCAHVEEEIDGNLWFRDIKRYMEKGEYPKTSTHTHKCTLRRLANYFFQSEGILYRRIPDMGLLRCVDAKKASKLLEEIHAGTCRPHMNRFTLVKKILRGGYFWMTIETYRIKYVQKCHQCQIHADMIRVPPNELNATSSPWPLCAWGMDVIGAIEPAALNRHSFILVAIDYFTKWVEATSYKAATKKVVAEFFRDRIVCRFGLPDSINTDNAVNLNSDLMKAMCKTFKIKHKNSTTYMSQMNGVIEAANKNIKKILWKIVDNYK
ncbi:uncharacterized protein [Nicotiana tomentosiformis]|uniref:uncharacterized protein n=1 Tax=Nicotiana tomentosiformis TaxID=4098 RepID=UPI00388CEB56